MSTMSKPKSSHACAPPRPSLADRLPNSCAEIGCSSVDRRCEIAAWRFLVSQRRHAVGGGELGHDQAAAAQIADKRRKTVSVTPAMGASTVAGAKVHRTDLNRSGNPHASRHAHRRGRILPVLAHGSILTSPVPVSRQPAAGATFCQSSILRPTAKTRRAWRRRPRLRAQSPSHIHPSAIRVNRRAVHGPECTRLRE